MPVRFFLHRTAAALALTFALGLPACQTSAPLAPASSPTRRGEPTNVDDRIEAEIGRRTDQALVEQLHVYDDARLTAYVDGVLDRMAKQAGPVRHDWTLRILDTSYVTARSSPGGYVYLTRGLLAFFGSEAELAAAIAHEIAHVSQHHWHHKMEILEEYGIKDGDLSRLPPAGRQRMLARLRQDEREADELAIGYLERAGYSHEGLTRVIELFAEIERQAGGQRIPPELRTHPETATRLRNLAKRVGGPGETEEQKYLAHIDGLLFGEDPRQGYLYGERYVNPVADLELALAPQWRARLIGHDLLAVLPDKDAVLVVSRSEHGNLDATRQALAAEGMSFSEGTVAGRPALIGRRQEPGGVTTESALLDTQSGVYVLGVVAPPEAASTVRSILDGAHRISEPALAQIAPLRVRLDKLPRAMSLADYVRERPSKTNLETLVLLNHTSASAVLPAGSTVKRIDI